MVRFLRWLVFVVLSENNEAASTGIGKKMPHINNSFIRIDALYKKSHTYHVCKYLLSLKLITVPKSLIRISLYRMLVN